MSKKADRLKAHAVAGARKPKPSLLEGPVRKRGFKVLGVSVYTDDFVAVERLTRELQRAGYHKANRSFVVQAAIRQLNKDLEGKSSEEMVRYFTEHAKRDQN